VSEEFNKIVSEAFEVIKCTLLCWHSCFWSLSSLMGL